MAKQFGVLCGNLPVLFSLCSKTVTGIGGRTRHAVPLEGTKQMLLFSISMLAMTTFLCSNICILHFD